MEQNKQNSGFSLMELSIVILIAGLGVAAVTGGQHMMQASKLNRVINEITTYSTAINNFKDKYKGLPGDLPNATSFWVTTNGDGNEQVVGATTEALYAWQQMGLSGLISGSYTGSDAGTPDLVVGTNVPAGSLTGSNYYLYYYSAATAAYTIFGTSGNALQLGSVDTAGNTAWGAIITPADAHVIDVKIDDGLASAKTGNLYAIPALASGAAAVSTVCVDNNYASASATYILTDTTASCRLLYWINKL